MKSATLAPTPNVSPGTTGRARVVVAFPLTPSALEALTAAVGSDLDVMDIRVAPAESDLVLCRPCSPGAIRSLKRTFPAAEIVVVDSPPGFGSVALAGPVSRMRCAGADLYMTGASMSMLASAIRDRVGPGELEARLVCDRQTSDAA
jgi:hypothetical protein